MKEKTYTENGVWRALKQLVAEAQNFTDQAGSMNFIKKHPWSIKFLSGDSWRHNNFLKLVNDEDFRMEEDKNELLSSKPKKIRVRFSVVDIRYREDIRTQMILFQEIYPKKFIFLDM